MTLFAAVQDALAEVYSGEVTAPEARALIAALEKRGYYVTHGSSFLDAPDPEDFVGFVDADEDVF